ncbi:hypothetical protein D9M71_335070 [compost metagenome]
MGQRRARGDAGAGDHVKHTAGVAGFQHKLGQFQCGQWGFVGRLEYHGATGGQGWAEFPAGQQQGEVPGHDGTDHADRLAADKTVELIVGHQWQRYVQGGPFDLGRPAGHIAQKIDGQLHVHHPRHRRTLAVVQAFELGKDVGVALQQVGQAPQQVLPFAWAGAGPGRIIEGLAGGEHGAVDIGGRGRRHLAQHFAGGGVAQVHQGAIGGTDPFGPNQHVGLALQECLGGGVQGRCCGHGSGLLLFGRCQALSQPLCQCRIIRPTYCFIRNYSS